MALTIQYASNLTTLTEEATYSSTINSTATFSTFDHILDIHNTTNVLVLSGNIGDPYSPVYEKFIKWCANRVHTVLIIAGGQEYANRDSNKVDQYILRMVENLNKKSNYGELIYLQNNNFRLANVEFIGKGGKGKSAATLYGKDQRYVFVTADDNDEVSLNDFDCVIKGNKILTYTSACTTNHPQLITIADGLPVWAQ